MSRFHPGQLLSQAEADEAIREATDRIAEASTRRLERRQAMIETLRQPAPLTQERRYATLAAALIVLLED